GGDLIERAADVRLGEVGGVQAPGTGRPPAEVVVLPVGDAGRVVFAGEILERDAQVNDPGHDGSFLRCGSTGSPRTGVGNSALITVGNSTLRTQDSGLDRAASRGGRCPGRGRCRLRRW